jgi:hypothetical protein
MDLVLIQQPTGLPSALCRIAFEYTEHSAMMTAFEVIQQEANEGKRCYVCFQSIYNKMIHCTRCKNVMCHKHASGCELCWTYICTNCSPEQCCSDMKQFEKKYLKLFPNDSEYDRCCSISQHNRLYKLLIVKTDIDTFLQSVPLVRHIDFVNKKNIKCGKCARPCCEICELNRCEKCGTTRCNDCFYKCCAENQI